MLFRRVRSTLEARLLMVRTILVSWGVRYRCLRLCFGPSGEEEVMGNTPSSQLLFFDDFCLPVSTFPLAVCEQIRDGLYELTDDENEHGNIDPELGVGIGWAGCES